MKAHLASFSSGLMFALGLGLAGMTQVDKVIGFLDLPGNWDPSLALVMVSAIGVHMLAYRFVPALRSPWTEDHFRIPTRKDIDWRLVGGSAIFGTGWALAGFCPGPAIVSLGSGSITALVFMVGLVGGMLLFRAVDRTSADPVEPC